MSCLHFVNLCFNSHNWTVFLRSSELFHTVLRIALWFQDVLIALSLGLFVLIRKSLVSYCLRLLGYLLLRWIRFVCNTVLFISAGFILLLLRLCWYRSITGVEELSTQNLIEAELRSHRDIPALLDLIFHLPLIYRLNYLDVLVIVSFMTSDTVFAPSPKSHTEYARAHAQSNKP